MKNLLFALAALLSLQVFAAELDASTIAKVDKSLAEGARYLIKTQNEDGSWGKYPHPAISALAVMALHEAPGLPREESAAAVDKAMAYVLSFRQKDGAIYPASRDMKESANYPNYTTSIALLAMATVNDPKYLEAMKAARAFMKASQFGDPDKVDFGGVGYAKTGRADLSNGAWAAEALYFTSHLDQEPISNDPNAAKSNAKMWADLATFLTKCQNLPETNKENYVSDKPEDLGGFVYRPNESKAGEYDGADGEPKLISSGSMTYAGLKSMIYARLQKDDVRVKGALKYLMNNYTLAENPGMGMQGHYYYLLSMTKALNAFDQPILTDAKGEKHDWRAEVVAKTVSMQSADGHWSNDNGRFMEALPELATPYAMMILKAATHRSGLQGPQ